MKVLLVTAIIKPFKLEELKNALCDTCACEGMTVTDVKGFGRQKGHTEIYRGSEYEVDFLPKYRVDLVIKEEDLSKYLETIQKACKTNRIGDGKIWWTELGGVMRLRTGEKDEAAI